MFALVPWLATLFSGLISWFASFLAKKWAVRVALISVFISITVSFTLAIHGLIMLIRVSDPGGWYNVGLSLLPTNFIGCIGAYIAAVVTRWVYDYKMGFMGRWLDQGL